MNSYLKRIGIVVAVVSAIALAGCDIRKPNKGPVVVTKQEQVVAPVSLQSLDARVTALEARNARIAAQAAQRAKAAKAAQ